MTSRRIFLRYDPLVIQFISLAITIALIAIVLGVAMNTLSEVKRNQEIIIANQIQTQLQLQQHEALEGGS